MCMVFDQCINQFFSGNLMINGGLGWSEFSINSNSRSQQCCKLFANTAVAAVAVAIYKLYLADPSFCFQQ